MSAKAARRYAKTFLDIARDNGAIEAVRADFDLIDRTVTASSELQSLLASPVIGSAQRLQALQAVFSSKVSPLTIRFLAFLESMRRAEALALIARAYAELVDREQGIQRVTVTSAQALAPEQAQAIRERLLASHGVKSEITVKVDPALLGGFTVTIGDRVLDYSIRSQLTSLKKSIVNA